MLICRNIARQDKNYQKLKNKKFYSSKMAYSLFNSFCTIIVFVEIFGGIERLSGAQGSIASVDINGAYNKLTVKITDQVPRQLCQQTLDTLEVRISEK